MNTPLPSKRKQRKCQMQFTRAQAYEIFELLNDQIFDNQLFRPSILFRSMRHWGECAAYDDSHAKVKCAIRLHRGMPCVQWLVTILAHEMAHQHQWFVNGPHRAKQEKTPLMSHGPSFFVFRSKLAKFGILLQKSYSLTQWIQSQRPLET